MTEPGPEVDGDRGKGGEESCGQHAGIGAELRALVLGALDRIEPALQRVREQPPTPTPESCAGCPVCAVLALLRGERPELAVTLAEQLGGLLAVLRTALEEGDPAPSVPPAGPPGPAEPSEPGPASGRRVQRIRVERVAP